MNYNLIPQKNVRIGWNNDREDVNRVTEFSIINLPPGEPEPIYFQNLQNTEGNCCSGWAEMNEVQLTMAVMRIFFEYDFGDQKKQFLIEVGRIKELQEVRNSIHNLWYRNLFHDEFMEKVYS